VLGEVEGDKHVRARVQALNKQRGQQQEVREWEGKSSRARTRESKGVNARVKERAKERACAQYNVMHYLHVTVCVRAWFCMVSLAVVGCVWFD